MSLGEGYLLWPWRAIYMWQCLCVACVGLISFFCCCRAVWFGCLPSLSSVCAGCHPLSRTHLWSLRPSTQPESAPAAERLGLLSAAPGSSPLCRSLSVLRCTHWLPHSPLRLQSSPSVWWSPHQGDFPACGNLASSTAPSHELRSHLDPLVFLCVCHPIIWDFLAFLKVRGLLQAFSRCPLRTVLHEDGVFFVFVREGELHILLPRHLDLIPQQSKLIRLTFQKETFSVVHVQFRFFTEAFPEI